MSEKGGKSNLTMRAKNYRWRVNPYEFNRSMAIFMKEYFKKHPSSSRTEMIWAFRKETQTPMAEESVIQYSIKMIRSYRLLRCEFDKLKSCANRKKLISEHCPFYDDIHEAYQYSDYYRNSDWKPMSTCGRPPQKTLSELQPTTSNASNNVAFQYSDFYRNYNRKPDARSQNTLKSSESITSKSTKDNKNEKSKGCLRVIIEPIKQKAVKCKLVKIQTQETPQNSGKQEVAKTAKKPETSTTKTVHKTDKCMRNTLEWTPELQIQFAGYMRDYYKKEPKVTLTILQKMMYKHFNLNCNVGNISFEIYHHLIIAELRSKRCPYFFEIHEAYQYSDFYRNCNWQPKTNTDPKLWRRSELQPTTRNASSDES